MEWREEVGGVCVQCSSIVSCTSYKWTVLVFQVSGVSASEFCEQSPEHMINEEGLTLRYSAAPSL